MSTSNNILGIEYLKELYRLKANVQPLGVQRIKAPSASQIRLVMLSNSEQHKQIGMFDPQKYLQSAVDSGDGFLKYLTPVSYERFASTALFAIMTKLTPEVYNSNQEICNLIRNLHPVTYRQLKEQAPTKRFAVSRIARLALHSALDVHYADIRFLYKNNWLPYTNLLAINTKADSLFAALALNQKTPLIVRGNKIKPKQNKYYHALRKIDERAKLLYESVSGEKGSYKCEFV